MKPIYLDFNATTPILPEVAAAMQPYLSEIFGNPSSSHWYGVQSKKAVEKARKQVADLLGCQLDEIVFTSGGSESNNYAIKGIAHARQEQGNHIITSSIEHPAVVEVCHYLEQNGFQVTYLAVDADGLIDLNDLEKSIVSQTILITIMHANNEVGTIQPISEVAKIAHEHNIVVHSDGAQAVGKIPTRIDQMDVDLYSIAGHKLYAPKGIGALYIRRGIHLDKQIHGANHERNLRAGTENVLEIVGLGQACEIAQRELKQNMRQMQTMRDRLYNGIRNKLDQERILKVNGHATKRLPNTLSISFANIEANTLLSEIEDLVAASAGAACHTDEIDLSPTLQAMQVPLEYAMGTLRLSTGKTTSAENIDRAVEVITDAVKRLSPNLEGVSIDADFQEVKLTHYTHGLGCACKLRPQQLEKILADLPVPKDKNILIGTNTADDAAVYRLDDDTAIVQTVDFFTPIVDNPYDFGAIAAANALSDIYAMGAKPLFALNIVGFPSNRLPLEILHEILSGAQDKAQEAGISIIGGHTVEDTEPKFGLAVCGIVHPGHILTNAAARADDVIILTKPIGTGILTTALKRGLLDEKQALELTRIMATLNNKAAEILLSYPVNACTDVTGFGLLGHLKEMTTASRIDAELIADQVPILEPAGEMATAGTIPGGSENNLKFMADWVMWGNGISEITKILLCDAQTSGGLLISISAAAADGLMNDLRNAGIKHAAIIGRFLEPGKGKISVT
jgi:cysteine desulfurase NifS/selenium donor protein